MACFANRMPREEPRYGPMIKMPRCLEGFFGKHSRRIVLESAANLAWGGGP